MCAQGLRREHHDFFFLSNPSSLMTREQIGLILVYSAPAGAVAIALIGFLLPSNFPFQGRPSMQRPRIFSKESIQRIDFLGAFLLIGANLTLVTALLEASTSYSWSSPVIIALLVVSAILWMIFVAWEWFATKDTTRMEPVFPFRFFHNRYWMGMLLQSAFVGVPFTVLVVDLPQRFQSVNNLSALDAGVRLLPYAMLAPLGSLTSNLIFMRRKAPLPILCAGASFQLVGLVLLATMPASTGSIPAAQYGYEAIAGFGVGITFGTLVTITPGSVDMRDLATATGAMIQFRQMVYPSFNPPPYFHFLIPYQFCTPLSFFSRRIQSHLLTAPIQPGRSHRPHHRLQPPQQLPEKAPVPARPHNKPVEPSPTVHGADPDVPAATAGRRSRGVCRRVQPTAQGGDGVRGGTFPGYFVDA